MLPSTISVLKASLEDKAQTPKANLDQVYQQAGDVVGARSLGQLPRGPSDLYNARYSARRSAKNLVATSSATPNSASIQLDGLWVLLERAKREEELTKADLFIRECVIHPSLLVILASDRQMTELQLFCTHPAEFSILSVDPTFNIFDKNLSLTVTTYRNLRLTHKETGKPPVFVGPLLMHQKKDCPTYSKFSHRLVTENPALEGLLACGTDGEKALIDGLARNFRYAIFLRCFIHFKDNIKRELARRGVSPKDKKSFIEDIFGKIDGETKFYGLVDCETEDEVTRKLESLRDVWFEREGHQGNESTSFYEWFRKEKVSSVFSINASLQSEAVTERTLICDFE